MFAFAWSRSSWTLPSATSGFYSKVRILVRLSAAISVFFQPIQRLKIESKGLQEVEEECKQLSIPFHLLIGEAKGVLVDFVKTNNIGAVVNDFAPLRVPMQWVDDVKSRLPSKVPFVRVDAHNIVPVWITSEKQEYAARTIRPKIHKNLAEYLTPFPAVRKNPYPPCSKPEVLKNQITILCSNMVVTFLKSRFI